MMGLERLSARQIRHLVRCLTIALGAALATAVGLLCLKYAFAEPIVRLSYDVPFLLRSQIETHEVVLVYLDEFSAKQLHQPFDIWDRELHVRLLERLTQEQPRLVFYDVVFDQPGPDPATDAAFAESIKKSGRVILGAALDHRERQGMKTESISAPIRLLRKAAAGWGTLAFEGMNPDYGVRRMYFGNSVKATATWEAAKFLHAPITNQPRETLGPHFINYYGRRGTFASVSFAQVLLPDGVPPGYFKDKIVMIGGQFALGGLMVGRDEFATPYSRLTHDFTPGTEVHAHLLLNLLRGDWLIRMPLDRERAFVIIVGLFAGALALFRPLPAIIVAVVVSIAIGWGACLLLWHQRIWFGWLIPAGVQIPLGLAWCLTSQYLLESRRRKELRRAFGFYLSPEMADRIADSDFDLHPGGRVVEATVIFTDLENFTTLSEKLDPSEVSSILIAYFEQTTQCILKNRGTIIKYVGDAVMAAWGAPVEEPAHAIRAVEAACDLRCLSELNVRGRNLRTRVGVNSGKVLAGNLGSSFRFDYTMIGDTTNFASRLESLNKYLSTQVLISDSVRQQLDDRFVTRRLGQFRVAGKTESVLIHELICRCADANGEEEWIAVFESGLESFKVGDFSSAAELMRRTAEIRGSKDGPAEFYLRKVAALKDAKLPEDWRGVIELSEK
jgi:adenylate cyclase